MFVFDLFEKKKQDTAAGRFVGGTSQDARVKNALDNAYRAVPAAKSPEEAALGYIDIQNSLNQKQDQALDQQTKTNQQQTKQINDLVNDMRRKEKDFRDLNAQIANMPNVTPQQAAKMAQDIEASHDTNKDQPADISNVIAKQTATQPAKTVAAPSPGASVSQLANYQQAKDQGAATAKTQPATPQATPAPAPAVTPPGRVVKGKNQSNAFGQMAQQLTAPPAQQELPAAQPAQSELPAGVADLAQARASKADKEAKALAAFGGQKTGTYNEQAVAVPSGAGDAQIAAENEKTIVKAYIGDTDADLTFLSGPPLKLKVNQVHALVDAFAQIPDGMNKDALKTNLFSNRAFLIEWMFENIVNPATATNRPTDVDQNELNQGQLALEGEVIPMTGSPSVPGNVKAYQYALEILKAAFDDRVSTAKIDQMKQVLFHDFQARIQQAPDGTYYLNVNGAKSRLPDPRTFPMEEDSWHNGQNSWSSEHDQWAKESTDPTSAKDTIQRYLGIDKQTDVEAVKAAIHAIGSDATLKPNSKARLLGQVGMIINRNRLPIGRTYYQFMQRFMESQGKAPLSVGDPVIVTAPNEFEGKTGEIAEFSPSGKFIIVNLYNYGEHSMHLSDVEYNQYADEEIDEHIGKVKGGYRLYSKHGSKNLGTFPTKAGAEKHEREVQYFKHAGEGVEEGWSNKALARRTGQLPTSYSVYIKGKEWKSFADDDHAEAVANKLRAKFKAEGRDPSVITIAATGYDKGMDEALSKKDLLKQIGDKLNDPEFRKKPADPTKRWEKGDLYQGPGPDDYGYTGYQGHGMPRDNPKKKKGVAEAGSPAQQAAIAVAIKKAGKKPKNESDDGDWVDDPNTHAQVNRSGFNKLTPQSYADKIDFIDRQLADPRQQQNWPEFKQRRLDLVFAAQRAGIVKEQDVTEIKKGQKDSNGVTKCWPGYHAQGTKKSATTGKQVRNCVPNEGVEEAQTDYQKRRQRERDIDAGKPVARQPKNPQTDYAKKRAKEKRDLEQFGESTNYWTRLQNERNTKIASLVSELTESVKDIK
jgi:hypothetical protein